MNIIITGASRGIGYETAKLFASDTANTVVVLSRNINKLNELKENCILKNPDSKIIPLKFDLEDISGLKSVIQKINSYFSSVDILINNAGFLINKPFKDISYDEASKVLNINFLCTAQFIRNLITFLGKNSNSHVINISSMGGFQGSAKFKGLSYYSSSKAAIACLTECLAEEFNERNISFNCLALGAVQTEMLSEAFPAYKAPLQANEIAEFIVDFAKNGNRYFNGKILPVSLSAP
ncbi:MAG: SDR family oxidoreductase [Bacteroidales bacterium]|nr:SDR family oxidoreductase [Bacteroidales bacterium]